MAHPGKLLIVDRDGVINYDSDDYIKSEEEWLPLPGSLDALAKLTDAGFSIVVVSNQSGVGRGLLSEATLGRIHAKMLGAVEAAGGRLAGIYYCPHRPDEGCRCRKPETGLLERITKDLGRSVVAVALIGDKLADMELARRAGARPMLVRTGYGEETLAALGHSVEVFDDLAQAAAQLIAEEST